VLRAEFNHAPRSAVVASLLLASSRLSPSWFRRSFRRFHSARTTDACVLTCRSLDSAALRSGWHTC